MADDVKVDAGADKGAAGAADAGKADAGKTDAAKGTIVDAGGAADKGGAGADAGAKDQGATPDWRAEFAGDDAEALKRLARFPDKAALWKSYRSMETKVSSGELKKALAPDATPEEKAAWRKENGFPEKAEGYLEKLELPKGLVLGDADKPIVEQFAAAALEGNVDPKQLSGMVAKYYEIQDAQRAAREDADATFKQQSEDALHTDWPGMDFRKNIAAVNNLIAGWPKELADAVLTARSHDGRLLGDTPGFIKQLASIALELNPASTLVPAAGGDPAKTIADELEGIRNLRRTEPDKYHANRAKYEAREIEIIDALNKTKARAA